MKEITSIIILLTITPVTAVTGLVTFDPNNWGGKPTIINIIVMAFFGLITVKGWVTYIPTLILTPVMMKRISKKPNFHSMPILKFIRIAVLSGMAAGVFILLPYIGSAATVNGKLFINWLWAGVLSGATTYLIIALIYRFED